MCAKGQTLRRYTDEERASALVLSRKIGIAQAAAKTGIPKGTLSYWRFADKRTGAAGTEAAPKAAPSKSTVEVAAVAAPSVKRVARVYTPSQKAQALETLAKYGPAEASRMLGISRFSLHEWKRKHDRATAQGTSDSPLAGSDEDPASKRDQRILDEWKKHPGLGPSQIRNQLRRESFKVSVRTGV